LLQRLQQLVAAVSDGHFPARWMPDANYGYGYPFYNYYAPLSIYIAALFRFLGFSFVRAIHLAQVAGFVMAGWGMALLAGRWLGNRWAGWLAAVAYTFAPFHMVNVYTRGDSLAEFWAMAFYPWVMLAADNLLQRPRHGPSIATFALTYAVLILSHNISALIFSPFLLLYLIIRGRQSAVGRQQSPADGRLSNRRLPTADRYWLFAAIGGLLLGLGLAAWFFLPALTEQELAQLEPVTAGYFHYSNHFRGTDLIQPSMLFDYSPAGGRAFRMGLVQAVGVLLGLACLVVARTRPEESRDAKPGSLRVSTPRFLGAGTRYKALFIVVTFLLTTLMITPLSRPLWDNLPLLPYTQFPWRFLSVQAFAGALLTGAIAWLPRREIIVPLMALALAIAGLAGLKTDHLFLTDEDVTPLRLAEYEWFTGNIGSTVSAEYLPPTAQPRPFASEWLNTGRRDGAKAVGGTLVEAQLLERNATRQVWRLEAGAEGATVWLPTLYWPGWQATADGQLLALRPYPGSGLITFDLPPGAHTVTLWLGRTPIRLAAELLSLAAVGIVVSLWIRDLTQRRKELALSLSKGRQEIKGFALFASLRDPLLLLSVLLILAWIEPERSFTNDDLTWDFAQMAYLHHDVQGVLFDNGARLQSYQYSANSVANSLTAGETLTVLLDFEAATGIEATLELATPALARPIPDGQALPPVFVAQTRPLNDQQTVFQLTISATAPSGLVIPRLTLAGARPLMPSGQTRGDLYLRPLRIEPASGNVPAAGLNEASPLDVVAINVTAREEQVLEGHFAWWTAQPLGANHHFSWRLQDANGLVLAQLDSQPGYGFQPSVGWPAGRPVNDWLALKLPQQLSGPGPYPLVMRLYQSVSGEELLIRRLGAMVNEGGEWVYRPQTPSFRLPDDLAPLSADFLAEGKPVIRLHGYRLDQSSDALSLTLYWEALEDLATDYIRFVHLLDPAAENNVAQVDGLPQGNSYPTSQWIEGEVIADSVSFNLNQIPPGSYRLATGFYSRGEGLPRLSVTSVTGDPQLLLDNWVMLPDTLTIP
jgi:hypothetical protein